MANRLGAEDVAIVRHKHMQVPERTGRLDVNGKVVMRALDAGVLRCPADKATIEPRNIVQRYGVLRIKSRHLPKLRERQVAVILFARAIRNEQKLSARAARKPWVNAKAEGHWPVAGIADRNIDPKTGFRKGDLLPRPVLIRVATLCEVLNQNNAVARAMGQRPRPVAGKAVNGDVLVLIVDR